MSETLKDAVRNYGRRHGLTEREAESVVLGAGLAALESKDDQDGALVRTMRLGMTVAMNLIQEDRDRMLERAWGVVNDCDRRVSLPSAAPASDGEPMASVVEFRTRAAR